MGDSGVRKGGLYSLLAVRGGEEFELHIACSTYGIV